MALEPAEVRDTGIEATYNKYLFGVPGAARVRVDSLGRPRSARTLTTQPQAGQTVRLTIDTGLQLAAQNALDYGIQTARNEGKWAADGGAIVAMSPKDGSILALASSPTYDPSVYTGRVTTGMLKAQGLVGASAFDKNVPRLINLAEDVAEANDLSAKYPDRVKELTAAWKAWSAEQMEPRWRPPAQARRGNPANP